MEDRAPLLEEIGLTGAEAKVFLALLDLGESTIGPVAERSGVSYSKIHILLEKLTHKGLVSTITKQKTRHFIASTPKKLLEYLDRKRATMDTQRERIERIIPQLEGRRQQLRIPEGAELYEGYEGLKTVYEEGLAALKKGDEILVLGASQGTYTDKRQYEVFFQQINRQRLEKGIAYRIIYNENLKGTPGAQYWQKQKSTKVRFLLDHTPGSVNIQGDRVLIIYWAEGEPKVFLITSPIVAASFRQYFEAIWTTAKA